MGALIFLAIVLGSWVGQESGLRRTRDMVLWAVHLVQF